MNNRLNPGAYRAPEPQDQKDLNRGFRAFGTVEASEPHSNPMETQTSLSPKS